MALIGTGMQAITQVAAVNAVRPLRRVRVWSPTAEKRSAFARQLAQQFEFDVVDAPTLEAATRDASIVTLVTRAKDPFVSADLLAPGTHVNAVGAILPANAEFLPDVFERASWIAVDDVGGVQRASREFIEQFAKTGDWTRVIPLGEIVAGRQRRPERVDLTLFKAMGMGVSDLSVAVMALERARTKGIGRGIAHPVRAIPRWKSAVTTAQEAT
jgi:ornithine cyclodeaminase/alanine dehydrogenase-like protein (mu-crystallin family)